MENHTELQLLPLLFVSLLAFAVPILASWFNRCTNLRIPAVVGEIFCGIIIGKSFLNLISDTHAIPWLEFLQLFGLAFLMFLSGLEIDFGLITSERQVNRLALFKRDFFKQPLVLAITYFLLTLLLSSTVAVALHVYGYIDSWIMMTLILSTTSVSVVVPTLKEKGLSKSFLGQTILLSALIADVLTMLLITVYDVAISLKGQESQIPSAIFFSLALLLFFIVLVYKLHISRKLDSFIRLLYIFKPILNDLAHTTTQIKVRGAMALLVTLVVLSQLLHIEVILGAFLAGILTTLILGEDKTSQLEMKLDAIGYGFFIPIFFIVVGINIDLHNFFHAENGGILLLFLVFSAFFIKVVPAVIFKMNFTLKEALTSGVLLSARLSLIIAASNFGLKAGLINEETNAAIVMVAVVSCTIAPIIFNKLSDMKKKAPRDFIVIIGAGRLAQILTDNLIEQNLKVLLSAQNDEEYGSAKRNGLPVVKSGNSIEETLIKVGITNAKLLLALTNNDDFNLSVCLTAREIFNVNDVISKVTEIKNIETFKEQDIKPINHTYATVSHIFAHIVASDQYASFAKDEEEIKVADVWLANPQFDRAELRSIKLPGNTLIVHIKRDDQAIVPHGNTTIYLDDHITLLGTPQSVIDTVNLLGIQAHNLEDI